jgi:hypothetical protein
VSTIQDGCFGFTGERGRPLLPEKKCYSAVTPTRSETTILIEHGRVGITCTLLLWSGARVTKLLIPVADFARTSAPRYHYQPLLVFVFSPRLRLACTSVGCAVQVTRALVTGHWSRKPNPPRSGGSGSGAGYGGWVTLRGLDGSTSRCFLHFFRPTMLTCFILFFLDFRIKIKIKTIVD